MLRCPAFKSLRLPASSTYRCGDWQTGVGMDKFFANLWLVVAVGFGVALVLMGLPEFSNAPGVQNGVLTAAFQWLHVFFGVLWIGLLYYLNFVQVPAMPGIPAELKPGVTNISRRKSCSISAGARRSRC